jgi:hypothetical protein
MDIIPSSLTEPPLTATDWQVLLSHDPIRACRRYYYQTALLVLPDLTFRSSLSAFQQLTQRAPMHFLSQAQRLLSESLTVEPFVLWERLTGRAAHHTNPYLDFVSLYGLFFSIQRNASFLDEQAQASNMPSFVSSDTHSFVSARTSLRQLIDAVVQRSASPTASDAKNRAHSCGVAE